MLFLPLLLPIALLLVLFYVGKLFKHNFLKNETMLILPLLLPIALLIVLFYVGKLYFKHHF